MVDEKVNCLTDQPKVLASQIERDRRCSLLHLPHVSSLTSFVDNMRESKGTEYQIPYFDPLDGGISARLLFLLEAPGPKAVKSGFISRNNPDETAKNFFLFNEKAGIKRSDSIIWNAVPWYLGTGTKIRPAKPSDVHEANEWLIKLLKILQGIEYVVIVGKKAIYAEKVIHNILPSAEIFRIPHTSPMCVNRNPVNRSNIIHTLCQISERLLIQAK